VQPARAVPMRAPVVAVITPAQRAAAEASDRDFSPATSMRAR
jgi:hypothetical protein